MDRLTESQREVVAANLVRLERKLRADYRGYVRRLGWEEVYSAGVDGYVRAVMSWNGACPYHLYAAFWVRVKVTAIARRRFVVTGVDLSGVVDRRAPSPARLAALREGVRLCMAVLHPQSRRYVEMAAAGHTQEEIGRALGVRRARVARIKAATTDRVTRRFPSLRSA